MSAADSGLAIFDVGEIDSIRQTGYYSALKGFDQYYRYMDINNDFVYIAANSRLEILDASDALHRESVGQKTDIIPSTYYLSEAFPNPFNSSTKIKFGLPQSSEIEISAFNCLGQQVAILASGKYSAGYHYAVFVTW